MASIENSLITTACRLILSHASRDDRSFQEIAESLVREFLVTNRTGEAKQVRDALRYMQTNGTQARPLNVLPQSQVNRSGDTLIRIRHHQIPREDLFLSAECEKTIGRIVDEYSSSIRLEEHGLNPSRRILFWGPPGCGKTFAAQFLSSALDLPLGIVRLGSLVSSFLGETSSNLQRVFGQAEQIPMVLLLDEVDAIAASRTSPNDVGELRRIVNSLLQCLDEITASRSLVILATNHQHLFDVAVWRRFDEVLEFDRPNAGLRKIYIKRLVSGIKTNGSIDRVIKETEGLSFADIRRAITSRQKTMVLQKKPTLAFDEIADAAKSWKSRISRASNKSINR